LHSYSTGAPPQILSHRFSMRVQIYQDFLDTKLFASLQPNL
jgi:hypothetical protein